MSGPGSISIEFGFDSTKEPWESLCEACRDSLARAKGCSDCIPAVVVSANSAICALNFITINEHGTSM